MLINLVINCGTVARTDARAHAGWPLRFASTALARLDNGHVDDLRTRMMHAHGPPALARAEQRWQGEPRRRRGCRGRCAQGLDGGDWLGLQGLGRWERGVWTGEATRGMMEE